MHLTLRKKVVRTDAEGKAMRMDGKSLVADTAGLEVIPFPIPGATPEAISARLVNVDAGLGMVTTIIHIAPGGRIPAHYHLDGAEAHFVIEGDFINAGVTLGPGSFVTHPTGVVHGPHESRMGCKVLTLQTAFVDPAKPDFHIVE